MHVDLLQWLRVDPELKTALAVMPGEDWPLIYWVGLPRNAKNVFPAMTMTGVSRVPQRSQKSEGVGDLIPRRVQFDIYSDDPMTAREVMDRLLVKFDFKRHPVTGDPRITYGETVFCKIISDSDRDMPITQGDGDGVDIFHISGDFIIWHRPVAG